VVKKKKVAIVIGRYYLTLPIIIGFYNLFDWEITVIDIHFDSTHVAREDFYKSLPPLIGTCQFIKESKLFRHLKKAEYDIVFANSVNHKGINKARTLGLIRNLYIIFGAFLKPSRITITSTIASIPGHVVKKRTLGEVFKKVLKWRSYYSFLNMQINKIKKLIIDEPNNHDAYDMIFCWNKAEAHYYDGPKQVIAPHPYHLLSASLAKFKSFSGKILIAHSGDPLYYTPGYNELINQIIETFSPTCEVAIKVHPLCQDLPKFNGMYNLVYKAIDEEKVNQYDIFINEDSYMGVEMFFRGKYVINFGIIDEEASNIDFTHLWSNDAELIIKEIRFVIDNWDAINGKHIAYLKQYFTAYIPPIEFGQMALHAS
jgi:hypothetical protein